MVGVVVVVVVVGDGVVGWWGGGVLRLSLGWWWSAVLKVPLTSLISFSDGIVPARSIRYVDKQGVYVCVILSFLII